MQVKYLALARDELFSPKIIKIARDDIASYHKELYQVITDIRKNKGFSREYFAKYLSRILGDAELLIRIRLLKAVTGIEAEKGSFDEGLIENINNVVSFLAKYLAGLLLTTPDGKVLLRVKEEIIIKKARYRPGDIVAMDLDKAVLYILSGMASPIESLIASIIS